MLGRPLKSGEILFTDIGNRLRELPSNRVGQNINVKKGMKKKTITCLCGAPNLKLSGAKLELNKSSTKVILSTLKTPHGKKDHGNS